jgi:hypothetical protein
MLGVKRVKPPAGGDQLGALPQLPPPTPERNSAGRQQFQGVAQFNRIDRHGVGTGPHGDGRWSCDATSRGCESRPRWVRFDGGEGHTQELLAPTASRRALRLVGEQLLQEALPGAEEIEGQPHRFGIVERDGIDAVLAAGVDRRLGEHDRGRRGPRIRRIDRHSSECDSRVENAKFDEPPSGLIPAATAIASSA